MLLPIRVAFGVRALCSVFALAIGTMGNGYTSRLLLVEQRAEQRAARGRHLRIHEQKPSCIELRERWTIL